VGVEHGFGDVDEGVSDSGAIRYRVCQVAAGFGEPPLSDMRSTHPTGSKREDCLPCFPLASNLANAANVAKQDDHFLAFPRNTSVIIQASLSSPYRPMKTAADRPRKTPSKAAIQRAVASSTAIETGKSIQSIEAQLRKAGQSKFRHIKLAG